MLCQQPSAGGGIKGTPPRGVAKAVAAAVPDDISNGNGSGCLEGLPVSGGGGRSGRRSSGVRGGATAVMLSPGLAVAPGGVGAINFKVSKGIG